MNLLEKLKNRARAWPQHIVLPEGEDRRAVGAAARVAAEGYARLTLLGRPQIIQSVADREGAKPPTLRSTSSGDAPAASPQRKPARPPAIPSTSPT